MLVQAASWLGNESENVVGNGLVTVCQAISVVHTRLAKLQHQDVTSVLASAAHWKHRT